MTWNPAASALSDLEARLARMPYPRLQGPEVGIVERALAAGVPYVPGLSLDATRVLTRRMVERAVWHARSRRARA